MWGGVTQEDDVWALFFYLSSGFTVKGTTHSGRDNERDEVEWEKLREGGRGDGMENDMHGGEERDRWQIEGQKTGIDEDEEMASGINEGGVEGGNVHRSAPLQGPHD